MDVLDLLSTDILTSCLLPTVSLLLFGPATHGVVRDLQISTNGAGYALEVSLTRLITKIVVKMTKV